MTLKSSEIHDYSWRISTVLVSLLVSSSSCHALLPLVVRPMRTIREMFLKILFNSPELNRSIIFSMYLDFHDEEDESISSICHNRRVNIPPGSTSVQILFPIGIVLVEEPAGSLLCGFALAFDRHAKSFASNFHAYSSSWTSGISCSLLFKFITNLFDPWEILTQEWVLSLFTDIILISTPYLPCKQQVAISNTGPILVFPWIHPFGCDASSSLGSVVPLHEIVRILQCLSSWNTVRLQQHSEILHPYKICSICLVVIAFQFVLHTVAIEDLCEQGHHNPKELLSWSRLARMRNSIALSQRVAPFFREGFVLFTHFCDCSVKTELIYRSNHVKKSLNRFQIGTIVYRQFSMAFAFESTSGQWTCSTENWMSAFCEFQHHPFRNFVPNSLWTIFTDRVPLLFRTRTNKWPLSFSKSFCIQRYEIGICHDILFHCLLIHRRCRWTSTWI